MPAVSAPGVEAGVAGVAERHQVLLIVGSALAKRPDVVDHRGDRRFPFLPAGLAERMLRQVCLSDSSPVLAVTLCCLRVTLEPVVPECLLLLMQWTESSIREVGTAWMAAWSLWSVWH